MEDTIKVSLCILSFMVMQWVHCLVYLCCLSYYRAETTYAMLLRIACADRAHPHAHPLTFRVSGQR